MPKIAVDADAYAAARVGIFFPATSNGTGADGDLTGQCVTLNKWFLAEMTEVPSPFAARGDARYVGQTLVAQGHAVKVPYEERREGDFAVYEYGQYGHIGLILSGDRIFEQNANVGGAARRVLADGTVVYASRIGSLNEGWRPVRPTIYRIKSYQGGDVAKFTPEQEKVLAYLATGSYPGKHYNYPYSVKEITPENIDAMLQTWASRQDRITKEMENTVADGITGVKGVIGWNGYNSKFVGQPVVLHYPNMVQHWINYKNNMPAPEKPGKAVPLNKGLYEVK